MAWWLRPNGASQTYMALGATSQRGSRNLDVVTVDGGARQRPHHPERRRQRHDQRRVRSRTSSASACAARASVNNYQITLGSGADIIQLGVGSNAANSTDVRLPRPAPTA